MKSSCANGEKRAKRFRKFGAAIANALPAAVRTIANWHFVPSNRETPNALLAEGYSLEYNDEMMQQRNEQQNTAAAVQ